MEAWWKLYPIRGNGWVPHPPSPSDRPDPRFAVGVPVRLRSKPVLARRVLAVEWHSIRREFSYIVETSAAPPFRPYWFAGQLAGVDPDAEPFSLTAWLRERLRLHRHDSNREKHHDR